MSDREPTVDELRAELRALAQAMREVSQDGRMLAGELAATITDVVALQCDAIEERLAAVMTRLDAIERDAA